MHVCCIDCGSVLTWRRRALISPGSVVFAAAAAAMRAGSPLGATAVAARARRSCHSGGVFVVRAVETNGVGEEDGD